MLQSVEQGVEEKGFDFEDFGMSSVWSPWINSGQVMVFAIDTLDKETWSNKGGDPYWRIRRHEQWVDYITGEMVPLIQETARRRGSWKEECLYHQGQSWVQS